MKISAALVLTCLLSLLRGSTAAGACQLCALYTVGKSKESTSRMLGLDLRAKKSCFLGPPATNAVSALAADPESNLYAVTNPTGRTLKGQSNPGMLHHVDRRTGSITPIGNHQFKKVNDIAFKWNDKTLWGWAEGVGLIQFDTGTGSAALRFRSKKKFKGIAWANDGSVLYAIDGKKKELWAYHHSDKTLERMSKNLPEGATAIEMRSDGFVTGITKPEKGKGSEFFVTTSFIYDLKSLKVVSLDSIRLRSSFSELSGLTYPRACGLPTPGGKFDMIKSIKIEPYPQACIGQDVKVTVDAVHPLSDQGALDVSVNDRPGTPQYLKFTGLPGPRLIEVTASTKEQYLDFKSLKVEVVECVAEFLELASGTNPFRYDTIDFEVVNANDYRSQAPTYHWDFGDGNPPVDTGSVPYVSYVYADVVQGKGRDQLLNTVLATVTLSRPGHEDLVGRKVVPIWNMYAKNKESGVIQLFVNTDGLLTQSNNVWTGEYTLLNVEDESITLKQLRSNRVPCDPDKSPVTDPPTTVSLLLPAKQSLARTLSIPADRMVDMCGLEIYLSGPGQGGGEVLAAVYFATAQSNPATTDVQADGELLDLLNLVSNQGLVADPLHTTDEELYALGREQKITFPIATAASTRRKLQEPGKCSLTKCDPRTDQDSCLGKPCIPGDPTRPGISCQVTDDWCTAPAYIANALKGDIIASVGCDSMIGNLLRKLSPPQLYSHVGIMTRNHFEITHSTSAASRYEEHRAGLTGTDGILEGVLRYGWPGVITQTVSNAFNGEKFQDPFDGKTYNIAAFESVPQMCPGATSQQYPIVVKPPPGSSQQVRNKLIAAADTAIRVASDGAHYRFFAYSNADIVESRAAPSFIPSSEDWLPAKGWAENSLATVCSSFVWYCLKDQGITLEGPLDEKDVEAGAMKDESTKDGLYLYTEDERYNAARWLFQHTYNNVYDQEFGFEFLLDGADNIANQLVNCFVFDSCEVDTSDSNTWKMPGVGRAVSPDDIVLFWDSPEQGGVYGYNEPLVYRGGDHRRVATWQISEGVGAVVITVRDSGLIVEGASVEVAGIAGSTDSNGIFQDDKIPAGTYDIVATKLIGGYFKSARVTITVDAGETTVVTVNLELPPQYIRRVRLQGTMFLRDDETTEDETETFTLDMEARLDVYERSKRLEVDHCVGDEVRGELKFDLYLSESDDTSVELRKVSHKGYDAHFWLFEGTSCDTDDLEGALFWHPIGDEAGTVVVPAGADVDMDGQAVSGGFGGGDEGILHMIVSNKEETFP